MAGPDCGRRAGPAEEFNTNWTVYNNSFHHIQSNLLFGCFAFSRIGSHNKTSDNQRDGAEQNSGWHNAPAPLVKTERHRLFVFVGVDVLARHEVHDHELYDGEYDDSEEEHYFHIHPSNVTRPGGENSRASGGGRERRECRKELTSGMTVHLRHFGHLCGDLVLEGDEREGDGRQNTRPGRHDVWVYSGQ